MIVLPPVVASSAPPPEKEPPAVGIETAASALFLDNAIRKQKLAECSESAHDRQSAIRCLLQAFYKSDPKAASLALELYERSGNVIGVEVEHDMDGGYRGMLHLVPEPAVGQHRKHLEWINAAAADHQQFFKGLEGRTAEKVNYRWAPILFRVFRSVGRRTPAAYASGWTIAYNVSGTLNISADMVRETLFHETFHLDDQHHDDWSAKTLNTLYDKIVAKCGAKTACLQPYAPNDTVVRGGTYYAFQPGNDVREYAAELAIRYYKEHRAMFVPGASKWTQKPFKCGPAENAESWDALRKEFFGNVDLTPACKTP